MILNVHSDSSYLPAAKSRSCAGGYSFLDSLTPDGNTIQINGNIMKTCKMLKLAASSVSEAELGRWFSSVPQFDLEVTSFQEEWYLWYCLRAF